MSLFLRTTLFATLSLLISNHDLIAAQPQSGGKTQTAQGTGSGKLVIAKAKKGDGIHFSETNKGIDAEMKVDGKTKTLHFADAAEMKEKRSDIYPRYEKLAKTVQADTKTSAGASVSGETTANGEQKKFADRIDSEEKSEKEKGNKKDDGATPDLSKFPEIAEAQKQFALKVKEMKKQIPQDWDHDTYTSEKTSFGSRTKKVTESSNAKTPSI